MSKKPTLYQRRVSGGLCGTCGETRDAAGSKSLCSSCKEKSRLRAARIREEKKASGLCITCGKKPPKEGSTRCQSCLDRQAADQNKRNKKRQAAGLCLCGAEPKEGCVLCQSCIDKRSEHSSKLYQERRDEGTCGLCGNEVVEGHTLCQYHIDQAKDTRRQAKVEALNAYGGCKCADCGCDDIDILQLDHVNTDGAAHRRDVTFKTGEHRTAGYPFYQWLKKNGFPREPELEVVCPSCNMTRYQAFLKKAKAVDAHR